MSVLCFCVNDTATTEIYTLSLHDALPISSRMPLRVRAEVELPVGPLPRSDAVDLFVQRADGQRSEEHTSELQSLRHLVCRLLLEKKKKQKCNVKQCCKRTKQV